MDRGTPGPEVKGFKTKQNKVVQCLRNIAAASPPPTFLIPLHIWGADLSFWRGECEPRRCDITVAELREHYSFSRPPWNVMRPQRRSISNHPAHKSYFCEWVG